jgi:hypothetical protein
VAFPVVEGLETVGPVESAIRTRFVGGETLRTLDQAKPFVLTFDPQGLSLILGQATRVRLPWRFLETIPGFLRQRADWVKAGGIHSNDGEPGTLDEYLKTVSRTDVARWLVVVLLMAKVVDVRQRPALSIRLGTGQVEVPPDAEPKPVFSTPTCPHGMATSDCAFCSRRFRR